MKNAFPERISISKPQEAEHLSAFLKFWNSAMNRICHSHPIWRSDFVTALRDERLDSDLRFQLAAIWSVNMIRGSYSFPRYVAALAARADDDEVRHGLLENAWDESG